MNTGKVRYVFRNWPIESIHPNAFKASLAAECAGDQGKYWEMHERLFADQNKLAEPDLIACASVLGMNTKTFQECVDSGKYNSKVRKDLADGSAAGVTGTPAFFLGKTTGQTLRTATALKGAKSYGDFKQALDSLLAEKGSN